MKFLLRKVLLAALPLICGICAIAAPSINPYNQELDQILRTWLSADSLHKLVLMDRIFRLRDYIADPATVSTIFEELAQATPLDAALVHSELQAYLNDVAALAGKTNPGSAQHWFETKEKRGEILAQARSAGSDAQNLELLAELEYIAGIPEAADHMQQAAEHSPTANRWEKAAAWTGDPFKKFSALQSALTLDQASVQARLDLAAYYIGRQQLEKADSLLHEALASAPNNFVAREQLAALYLNLGLRSAALQELRTLRSQSPASLWLQARLAIDYEQIGLLDDAARLAQSVLQYKRSDREQLLLLARFHQRRHMMADLQSDLSALLRLNPNSAELWSRLAELQLSAGDLEKARDSLKQAAALDPKNPQVHQRLADVHSRLHQPQQEENELAVYTKLLQKDHPPAKTRLDSDLLTNPRELAAQAFRHPPRNDDLALADIRIQELYPNGLTRLHVQQVFYIGSQAGAALHRVASIRYSPAAQNLRVLHARIWKANGSITEAEEEGETALADGAASMYYDLCSRQLRFSGLQKGDVVELEYSLSPILSANPYPGYFGELVTLAGRTPSRLKRYALIVPDAQPIFVHAERVPGAKTIQNNGLRTLVWELHDVAALPSEPNSPGLTELSPYVHISTMVDWQKLGAWYADLIRPQFVLDETLKQKLDSLLQTKRSDQEKITAIQEFVLRSTHYVALEFGIYSYKPYSVTQTYARRFGDCKDKASLMIALLQAAGIDAEIALVRTRALGDVAPAPASMAVFDHAIVYVPQYSLWLDATAEYAGHELPLEDQGALALTVNLNGAAQLRQIPMSTAAENYTRRTIHAQLTRQGKIHFSGSTITRGEGAPLLRRELSVPEQQLDAFRQYLAQVLPAVRVDSVAVHGADDMDGPVSVDFEGTLNTFENRSAVSLSSSWMRRNYQSNFAPTSARTQDLDLNAPWITEEEIRVSLPAGATIKQLPKDEEITTSFGSVRFHYEKSAHDVTIQSRVAFEKTRISVKEYPAFRQFCSVVEHKFGDQIVVDLPR